MKIPFRFTKFDGNATTPSIFQIPCHRKVINVDAASLEDIEFRKDLRVVALPNDPDYTSIDFVVIYCHEEKKARLWFIQVTVSDPKSHGCKETENFGEWIAALEGKGMEICNQRLVFLTPKATPVSALSDVPSALKASEILHCNLAATDGMSGNHELIEALKKQGRFESAG